MMATGDDKYMAQVVDLLCNGGEQLLYVLTAVTNAVQERLGEDVILVPRDESSLATEGGANLLTLRFHDPKTNEFEWKHYIFYGIPRAVLGQDCLEELLRVTLDVAHELAHLVLERGPGKLTVPVSRGLSTNDQKAMAEIEADWFAVCILQMYGFIFPSGWIPAKQDRTP